MLLQKETTDKERNLYWHFPNNWGPTGPGIGAISTIRSGDWKLIYYYRNQSFELFNIKNDIGELKNMANTYPDKVKKIATALGSYLKSVDAQRPTMKSSGELVPFPDEMFSEKY